MQRKKVFISSVQSEFAEERQVLFEYLTTDALLGKFFDPFIFENVPALNAKPSDVFLNEVENCDIYLGIFGQYYGYEDAEGVSPTEREFDAATLQKKTRFIYVKQSKRRESKEKKLIEKAEKVIVRKSFAALEQLKTSVYASLVNYLLENEIIRTTPFDATLHIEATIADLNEEKIREFIEVARRKRKFPFDKDADIVSVLTHLNLIKDGRITNAALLLFGNKPQRFFLTSEVKCAHFHGLSVSKPIPSYQVYKGNVFEMIDAAVDFVLSKINLYVGERNKSSDVDVQYELPMQAVTEAIVNAVAHRDYTSNSSVQVMLFADRLEISNPGRLPAGLTIEKLFTVHNSIPANPLLAESLYLYGKIERMGTGTKDIVNLCTEMGLKTPTFDQDVAEFRLTLYRNKAVTEEAIRQVTEQVTEQVAEQVTEQVTEQVNKLLLVFDADIGSTATNLMKKLCLKHRPTFIYTYIQPALKQGLVELVYPDSPNHPQQKYRLTEKAIKLRNEGIFNGHRRVIK